jgi:hypothetical protein
MAQAPSPELNVTESGELKGRPAKAVFTHLTMRVSWCYKIGSSSLWPSACAIAFHLIARHVERPLRLSTVKTVYCWSAPIPASSNEVVVLVER